MSKKFVLTGIRG